MTFLKRLRLSAFALPLLYTTALATPKPITVPDGSPSANWEEADVRGFDKVRLGDNVDFRRYKTFTVQQPTLEFDKNWLREHKSDMAERDAERIRESYTRVLKTALEETLSKDLGWRMVAEAGPDTLIVAPRLTQFRITAPDLSFRPMTKDFVDHAGSARLSLTLKDGASKTPLAELSDHSETRSFGGLGDLKQTNRGINLRDFKMLSKRWASRFGEYLASGGRS